MSLVAWDVESVGKAGGDNTGISSQLGLSVNA